MRGCAGVILVFLLSYIALTLYFMSQPKLEEPEMKMELRSLPIPDSTREIEGIDWSKPDWIYKENITKTKRKIRRRQTIDTGEQQIIIEGKRYRIQERPDGLHLIPIR